jgi:hypothetical protein
MIFMMGRLAVSWQDAWPVAAASGLRAEDGGEKWRCTSSLGSSARAFPTDGCGAGVVVYMRSNS